MIGFGSMPSTYKSYSNNPKSKHVEKKTVAKTSNSKPTKSIHIAKAVRKKQIILKRKD